MTFYMWASSKIGCIYVIQSFVHDWIICISDQCIWSCGLWNRVKVDDMDANWEYERFMTGVVVWTSNSKVWPWVASTLSLLMERREISHQWVAFHWSLTFKTALAGNFSYLLQGLSFSVALWKLNVYWRVTSVVNFRDWPAPVYVERSNHVLGC